MGGDPASSGKSVSDHGAPTSRQSEKHESLVKAMQALKPEANARAERKKAEKQAKMI